MATLLQSLEAEIASLEGDVSAKKAQLETLKAEAGDFISREVAQVESWVRAVKAHLFQHKSTIEPVDPASPAAQ